MGTYVISKFLVHVWGMGCSHLFNAVNLLQQILYSTLGLKLSY